MEIMLALNLNQSGRPTIEFL